MFRSNYLCVKRATWAKGQCEDFEVMALGQREYRALGLNALLTKLALWPCQLGIQNVGEKWWKGSDRVPWEKSAFQQQLEGHSYFLLFPIPTCPPNPVQLPHEHRDLGHFVFKWTPDLSTALKHLLLNKQILGNNVQLWICWSIHLRNVFRQILYGIT